VARSKLSKKDKQGIIVGATSLLGLVVLGMIPVIVNLTSVPYDQETLCPSEGNYAHTVILIDKTDPLTKTQVGKLRRLIERTKSEMLMHEKLSIYVLDDRDYSVPAPRFALCNPGTGGNASPIYQNPRLMQIKFEDTFGEPLQNALDGIELGETRPVSPVMEMIASIADLKDFKLSDQRRQLIIFSDMLQNMKGYSHYREQPDFDAFAKTDYARAQLVEMPGVEVTIYYLKRDGGRKRQTKPHTQFWNQYFHKMGAKLIMIDPSK
jgi:hypothetical protein